MPNLDLARRIRKAGINIFIEEDDAPAVFSSGLLISQYGGLMASTAVALGGQTAIVIYLTITANLPRCSIAEFGVELPWNAKVVCLPDPFQSQRQSNIYKFGSKHVHDFPRGGVINHLADVTQILSRRRSIEGALLGLSRKPIPLSSVMDLRSRALWSWLISFGNRIDHRLSSGQIGSFNGITKRMRKLNASRYSQQLRWLIWKLKSTISERPRKDNRTNLQQRTHPFWSDRRC